MGNHFLLVSFLQPIVGVCRFPAQLSWILQLGLDVSDGLYCVTGPYGAEHVKNRVEEF